MQISIISSATLWRGAYSALDICYTFLLDTFAQSHTMEPSFIAGEVIESPRKRPVDAVMPEVPSEKKAKGMKVWDTQLFISSSPFLFFLSFFQNSFSLFRLLRGYLFLMWTEMNSFFFFLFVYVGKYRLLELPLEIGFERNAFEQQCPSTFSLSKKWKHTWIYIRRSITACNLEPHVKHVHDHVCMHGVCYKPLHIIEPSWKRRMRRMRRD